MTDADFVARVRALLAEYDTPPAPSVPYVKPGELQTALYGTAPILELQPDAVYEGGIEISRAVEIRGHGARLIGVTRPALRVVPGTWDVTLTDLICTAPDWNGAVVQLGRNDDAQTEARHVPGNLRLERVIVPTHRGKRGFEVNSASTLLKDCEARDVYTTTGQDSSALGILNTYGDVTVIGGVYEGGSEAILVGGDTLRIQGCVAPQRLTFDSVLMTRPVSWKTDGVKRVVKNLFELKTGHHVIVRNCVLEHCWKDGQSGYGIMLTPTRGGSLVDVRFESCVMRDVGGGVNITGVDTANLTPTKTTGLVFNHCTFEIDKAGNLGTGWPFLLSSGPGTLDIAVCNIVHDGNAFVYHQGPQVERIRITGSLFTAGAYGIRFATGNNAANWQPSCQALEVTGNTITGAAAALRANLPENQYV